jgi:tRNA splicing endonuclease
VQKSVNNIMPITLKQELIQKITATEDEDLLQLLLADIDYFSGDSKTDVTDELSAEDLSELAQLVKEPFDHETESYEAFKKATEKWRIL